MNTWHSKAISFKNIVVYTYIYWPRDLHATVVVRTALLMDPLCTGSACAHFSMHWQFQSRWPACFASPRSCGTCCLSPHSFYLSQQHVFRTNSLEVQICICNTNQSFGHLILYFWWVFVLSQTMESVFESFINSPRFQVCICDFENVFQKINQSVAILVGMAVRCLFCWNLSSGQRCDKAIHCNQPSSGCTILGMHVWGHPHNAIEVVSCARRDRGQNCQKVCCGDSILNLWSLAATNIRKWFQKLSIYI